jgi:hypothetical protein
MAHLGASTDGSSCPRHTVTIPSAQRIVSKARGCHVLQSSWLCQVLSGLRKQRPVTPNDCVKIAASNLVLADWLTVGRINDRARLFQDVRDAAWPRGGLPPPILKSGRCTSMPHGRPAHYRLQLATSRKSVPQTSVAIALVPPDAQTPPPRPAGGSHCLGYHLGRAGEWQGPSEGPISRARQPLRAPR